MKSKVLLYNPQAVFFDMPLALMAIASQLDQDLYDITIVDARIDENAHESILTNLDACICVGITVLTGAPIQDALFLSQKIKAINPDLPIIWGGWHPSMFSKEIMNETPYVDFIVKAQGEETFKELVDAIERRKPFDKINGLVWRDEGHLRDNGSRPTIDMNSFNPSNYALININDYFEKKKKKQLDYISSTGCFFRCTFCADPFVFNRKFVSIDAMRVVDEITAIYRTTPFDDINFQDETFFTYPERIIDIAKGLKQNNVHVTWAATMRADQCHRISDENFEQLVETGMRRLLIGVESGSQEMMDWLQKDIKIEYVLEAAERCKKYGVGAIFPFIIGFPGESDESVLASLKMANQLSRMSSKFTTPIFYYKPYPGAQITIEAEKKGYQMPNTLKDWSKFDYVDSKGPWVSNEKFKLVENFKFYNKLSTKRGNIFLKPFNFIASKRINALQFALPLEKKIADTLISKPKLS